MARPKKQAPTIETDTTERSGLYISKLAERHPEYAKFYAQRLKSMSGQHQSLWDSVKTADAQTGDAKESQFYSQTFPTYSYEYPLDRLNLIASLRDWERRDPIIGRAIDVHTQIPLSKIRLSLPQGSDHYSNTYVLNFFKNMVDRVGLFGLLINALREYWLVGEAFIFAEDDTEISAEAPPLIDPFDDEFTEIITDLSGTSPEQAKQTSEIMDKVDDMEAEVEKEETPGQLEEAEPGETMILEEEAPELIFKDLEPDYIGWTRVMLLPTEMVRVKTYSYIDTTFISLETDPEIKELIAEGESNEIAQRVLSEIPQNIRNYIEGDSRIPLNTDPYAGGHVYQLARNKSPMEEHGVSLIERVLHLLIYRDKIFQAQMQFISRRLSPIKLVWAEGASSADIEDIRDQIDISMVDPEYTIVSNFEIHWQEESGQEKLLDMEKEFSWTERLIFIGMGLTEGIMTGEGTWSADRIALEVMNTQYLYVRDQIQTYIEDCLFKPVARRKGFVEKDKFGNEILLYPKITFTRLPLRDNQDTFEVLFNLYQKGSLPISYILEILNIDPEDCAARLLTDVGTVNDSNFNTVLQQAYNNIGPRLADETNLMERIADHLGLAVKNIPAEGGASRF